MSAGHGWLTPSSIPPSRQDIVVSIPDGEGWIAAFKGALLLLSEPTQWQESGGLTPEEVAGEFLDAIQGALNQ